MAKSIDLATNLEKQDASEVVGFWLTDSATKNNIHIHSGENHQKGVVIGYDVNECKDDKASRLAISVGSDKKITLQSVCPETKQVTHRDVPPAILHKAIKAMLERVRDDVLE